ncbi:MAG TPA: Re/Si-specific NAD(P)(+) transhydrogenase subunit alpha [Polyangiaceae bacterium]|jgi:NAD(P) transhydrogenase subunit alpha
MLRVLIAKERTPGEARVSATPETIRQMVQLRVEPWVSPGAGDWAFIKDKDYEAAGAKIASDLREAYSAADILLRVRALERQEPLGDEVALLKPGAAVIGFLAPYAHDATIRRMLERQITSLPMELVPRITRAQKMDALSSQASIAGYKAVLVAATHLPKYFPLLMTAAGTVKAARVVVMGAGVAGLQAIATAKRLGAVVEASDIRPEVKDQVESLGGKFIDLPDMGQAGSGEGGYARQVSAEFLKKQQALVKEHVVLADVVITTAQVPGKPAPKLVTADMVQAMRPGSVIVDLAVESGGNCELSEAGKEVRKHGVLLVGPPNLPATLPVDASLLYARNVLALLQNILTQDGQLNIDTKDSVTGPTLLTHAGQCFHAPTAQRLGISPAVAPAAV